jgi:outer membrane biogenesis lipoprotein LolB
MDIQFAGKSPGKAKRLSMSEPSRTCRLHVKRCITIVAIIMLIVLLVSCARETSLQDAVSRAINTTAQAQSYRQTGNTIYYVDSVAETTESFFELEYVAPDRSHFKLNSDGDWSEGIIIGDKSYVRSSDEPQWRQSPFQFDNNNKVKSVISYISIADEFNVLKWLVDLEQLPVGEVDGVNYSHYRGRIDIASFVKEQESNVEGITLPLNEMRQWEIDVELWIDLDDYIRQMTTEARFLYFDESIAGDVPLVTQITTVRSFDFNEVIIIEQPQID